MIEKYIGRKEKRGVQLCAPQFVFIIYLNVYLNLNEECQIVVKRISNLKIYMKIIYQFYFILFDFILK